MKRYLLSVSLFLSFTIHNATAEIHVPSDAVPSDSAASHVKLKDLGFKVTGDCEDLGWMMNEDTRDSLRGFAGQYRIETKDIQGRACQVTLFDKASGEKKHEAYFGTLDPVAPISLLQWMKKARPAAVASDEGCLKPDEQSKKWREKQLRVAKLSLEGKDGGLIDATRFSSGEGVAQLSSITGASSVVDGKRFSIVRRNRDGKFVIEVSGRGETQQWLIGEQPWYKDQYPNGTKPSFVIYKDGENNQIQANLEESIFAGHNVDFAAIGRAMKEAESNRQSEKDDPIQIRNWKLPDGPIGYVGLIDSAYSRDPVIGGMASDVRNFPRMLNEKARKCQFVANQGSDFIIARRSPKDILIEELQKFADKGIKSAYLNLAGHGNAQGIYFARGGFGGYHVLSPEDLAEVINSQPEMKITLSTVACLGGGMSKAMEEMDRLIKGDPDRVRVFLQAKVDGVNQEGRIRGTSDSNGGSPEAYSSYYQLFLTHFLDEGLNYGLAHLQADSAAKRLVPSDAEVWKPGAATKGIKVPSK